MRTSLLLLTIAFLTFCSVTSDPSEDFNADLTMSQDNQRQFLMSVSRYIGGLPRHGTHENKFESRFDEHYAQIASDHRLERLHVDSEASFTYFLATRPARSLYEKRVAIGGRFQINDQDSLVHYEEIFRTWRMTEPKLASKAGFLFEKMIAGADLTPWYPEQSGEEDYIEFPNSLITYDTQLRQWTSTVQ